MLSLAMTLGATAADDKTYVMKIALATFEDALHQYAKNYAAAVERDSGGRIKAEIYPASQLGSIARQAEGVQFGAIQCQIVAPEFLAGVDERFEVLAAPRPRHVHGGRTTRCRQSGGNEADARPRSRQGAAWRRTFHEFTVRRYRKNPD